MAAVRRVSLFEREIRVGLSSAAIEILFDLAQVLSEGAREPDGYYGSTMITIELARAAALVSDPCDASTVRRLADLVGGDPRVRERARALAAAEAPPGGPADAALRDALVAQHEVATAARAELFAAPGADAWLHRSRQVADLGWALLGARAREEDALGAWVAARITSDLGD